MKRKRTWAFVVLGFLTATLLAEGALRLIEATPLAWRILPVAEVSLYGPDTETGYALRPDVSGTWVTENRVQIRTNSLGLRDRPLITLKPSGQQRIALMGDSFAEALQVNLENTYQAIAEQILGAPTKNIEIVNFGLAGATPAVQLTRAKSRSIPMQPDIFLFMTDFTDFIATSEDDSRFPAYVLQANGQAALRYGFRESRGFKLRISAFGQAGYWLINHSKIATLINNRKNQNDERIGGSRAPSLSCENQQDFALSLVRDSVPTNTAAHLQAFLNDLDQLSHAAGSIPVVLSLNNLPGCTEKERNNLLTLLEKKTKGTEIFIVDFESILQKTLSNHPNLNKKDLYGFGVHKGNGHLNEIGHKIYGEAVANILQPYLTK